MNVNELGVFFIGTGLSHFHVQSLIQAMDADGDGEVSFGEFISYMARALQTLLTSQDEEHTEETQDAGWAFHALQSLVLTQQTHDTFSFKKFFWTIIACTPFGLLLNVALYHCGPLSLHKTVPGMPAGSWRHGNCRFNTSEQEGHNVSYLEIWTPLFLYMFLTLRLAIISAYQPPGATAKEQEENLESRLPFVYKTKEGTIFRVIDAIARERAERFFYQMGGYIFPIAVAIVRASTPTLFRLYVFLGSEVMTGRGWLDLTWAEFMHASTGCAVWWNQVMVWAAILGSLFSGDRLMYLTLSVSRSDILRYQRLQDVLMAGMTGGQGVLMAWLTGGKGVLMAGVAS
eukprot:gene9489-11242_t